MTMALVIGGEAMPTRACAAEPVAIEVASSADLEAAEDTVNAATSGEYVIKLTKDIEGAISISGSCPVTILGDGHTLTIGTRGFIRVNEDAHLVLGSKDGSDTLVIKGTDVQNNDVPGLLDVWGTCDMYSGVTLADREGNNYFGGGVTVEGGTFNMHGGTIENCGIKGGSTCFGGGVAVVRGGSFVMDDGEIKNCYADSDYEWYGVPQAMGGGVFVTGGSSFVMNGGTVSNNKATGMGGGVAVIASYDEVTEGYGTLKSYAELNGGVIENNSAADGAGIGASARYYAAAVGLWTGTPSATAAEKQGLHVGNVKITGNKASEKDGSGGGVIVYVVNAPASVSVDGATISGNSASEGGGLAAYANGIDKVTVKNAVLCNNTASSSGSDVSTSGTNVVLSAAKDMDENYLGKPDDVTGSLIDAWYQDKEDSRYAAQSAAERQEFEGYASISSDDAVSLIAASNNRLAKITFTNEDGSVVYGSGLYTIGTKADEIHVPTPTKESDDTYDYTFDSWDVAIADVTGDATYKAQFKRVFKRFGARYEFKSATDGKQLPDEVLALLPTDKSAYVAGDTVNAMAPAQKTVEVTGGTWTFKGYDRSSAVADMDSADDDGNVCFVGSWEFTKKTPVQPGTGGTTSKDSGDSGTSASSDTGLPRTSDAFSIGMFALLIGLGIVALRAAAVARK